MIPTAASGRSSVRAGTTVGSGDLWSAANTHPIRGSKEPSAVSYQRTAGDSIPTRRWEVIGLSRKRSPSPCKRPALMERTAKCWYSPGWMRKVSRCIGRWISSRPHLLHTHIYALREGLHSFAALYLFSTLHHHFFLLSMGRLC